MIECEAWYCSLDNVASEEVNRLWGVAASLGKGYPSDLEIESKWIESNRKTGSFGWFGITKEGAHTLYLNGWVFEGKATTELKIDEVEPFLRGQPRVEQKNKWKLKQKWFENKISFNAFLYCCEKFEYLQSLKEEGYLIVKDNQIVEGEFIIEIAGKCSKVGIKEGYTFYTYAGSEHGGEYFDLIYVTMRDIKAALSKFSCVHPKHIIKIK